MSGILILRHLLTNFEVQKYYQKEAPFTDIYTRNNLPKMKNESH